jgi:hypothetical protein
LTPTLFDLPIRSPEAAQLGMLILEQAGDKPLTQEIRNRIASREVLLNLNGIHPYFGSLERDPIHPSAVYLAVDAIDTQPLLLRMAPNATPASGLFPKSILIGRVPGPRGMELVLNAVSFSHLAATAIHTFATQVNPAFQSRPASGRSAIIVESSHPETVYPATFQAFQKILLERNLNMAGFADPQTAAWAAIRYGWRDGFVELGRGTAKEIFTIEQLKERQPEKQRAICTLRIDSPAEAAGSIDLCSRFLL